MLKIVWGKQTRIPDFKGKGTQKYKCLLSGSFRKTIHFDANCMEIRFLLLKLFRFYVFKMAANGGRHFEINIKLKNCKTQFISTKHAYSYTFDKCDLCLLFK